jgi:class 3 adenylate cyclase
MADAYQEKISRSMARYIRGSQRTVTILFTDIEDSTELWARLGDVDGRLLVDQHNRMLFPVISRFDGRIIKTIGDAVMAAFP